MPSVALLRSATSKGSVALRGIYIYPRATYLLPACYLLLERKVLRDY
jgi:hypothetical protein